MKKTLEYLKKHWAGTVVVMMVLFIPVSGWTLWKLQEEPRPQDLGPQLTYVGRTDFGCILWWCETQDYSIYYFATDMNEDEVKTYFKSADFKGAERQGYPTVADRMASNTQLYFDVRSNPERGFTLTNYDNTEYIIKTYRLRNTNKKHIIEILDSSYEIAKSAL